jgi:hypothetical protein
VFAHGNTEYDTLFPSLLIYTFGTNIAINMSLTLSQGEVVVASGSERLQLKQEAMGLIPGGCPRVAIFYLLAGLLF